MNIAKHSWCLILVVNNFNRWSNRHHLYYIPFPRSGLVIEKFGSSNTFCWLVIQLKFCVFSLSFSQTLCLFNLFTLIKHLTSIYCFPRKIRDFSESYFFLSSILKQYPFFTLCYLSIIPGIYDKSVATMDIKLTKNTHTKNKIRSLKSDSFSESG